MVVVGGGGGGGGGVEERLLKLLSSWIENVMFTYIFAYLLKLYIRILLDDTFCLFSESFYRLVFPPLFQVTVFIILTTWNQQL